MPPSIFSAEEIPRCRVFRKALPASKRRGLVGVASTGADDPASAAPSCPGISAHGSACVRETERLASNSPVGAQTTADARSSAASTSASVGRSFMREPGSRCQGDLHRSIPRAVARRGRRRCAEQRSCGLNPRSVRRSASLNLNTRSTSRSVGPDGSGSLDRHVRQSCASAAPGVAVSGGRRRIIDPRHDGPGLASEGRRTARMAAGLGFEPRRDVNP